MQSGTYSYKPYELTEDEVVMLGYELSTDFLQKQVSIMQEKVNRVYKNLIKIAKYLTTSKNDSEKKSQSLEDLSKDIIKTEYEVLQLRANIAAIIQVAKADLNNTRIYLEFENEQEKNIFIKNLEIRKNNLKEYQDNLKILISLNEKIKNVIEKVTLSNI